MVTANLRERVDAALMLTAQMSPNRLAEIEQILQIAGGSEGHRLLDNLKIEGEIYNFQPSKSLVTVIEYVRFKYPGEVERLANFLFIIKSFYQLSLDSEKDLLFIDLAAYMYDLITKNS